MSSDGKASSAGRDASTPKRPAADRRKGSSTAGNLVYCMLRVADLPLQHAILSHGLPLDLRPRSLFLPFGPPPRSRLPTTTIGSSASTLAERIVYQLSPGLSAYQTLVLLLATGSAAKHVWWTLSIRNYIFAPGLATGIAIYNTAWNTVNSALAISRFGNEPAGGHSATFSEVLNPLTSSIPYGVALYILGMVIEITSEIERKAFKAKPKNKDKPCADGLFGLARNINYGGYLLWRVGYATVCGGAWWGAFTALLQGADFVFRAVPEMDSYCEQRYGKQWDEVREDVPYRILPGIW